VPGESSGLADDAPTELKAMQAANAHTLTEITPAQFLEPLSRSLSSTISSFISFEQNLGADEMIELNPRKDISQGSSNKPA
jgi:hypothetical protein